jgi:hypothetical protein
LYRTSLSPPKKEEEEEEEETLYFNNVPYLLRGRYFHISIQR